MPSHSLKLATEDHNPDAVRAMAPKGKVYSLEAARSALNDGDEMVSGKSKDFVAEIEGRGEKEVVE